MIQLACFYGTYAPTGIYNNRIDGIWLILIIGWYLVSFVDPGGIFWLYFLIFGKYTPLPPGSTNDPKSQPKMKISQIQSIELL